jgi:hypothetical protein
MGNYKELKQAVSDVIKTNGNQEITGSILQNTLLSIINSVGKNFQYVGIAKYDTNPGTPDQNIFYIAGFGNYVNFNNNSIPFGYLGIMKWDGNWILELIEISNSTIYNIGNEYMLINSVFGNVVNGIPLFTTNNIITDYIYLSKETEYIILLDNTDDNAIYGIKIVEYNNNYKYKSELYTNYNSFLQNVTSFNINIDAICKIIITKKTGGNFVAFNNEKIRIKTNYDKYSTILLQEHFNKAKYEPIKFGLIRKIDGVKVNDTIQNSRAIFVDNIESKEGKYAVINDLHRIEAFYMYNNDAYIGRINPKINYNASKFGLSIINKPTEKILINPQIQYYDGNDFIKSLPVAFFSDLSEDVEINYICRRGFIFTSNGEFTDGGGFTTQRAVAGYIQNKGCVEIKAPIGYIIEHITIYDENEYISQIHVNQNEYIGFLDGTKFAVQIINEEINYDNELAEYISVKFISEEYQKTGNIQFTIPKLIPGEQRYKDDGFYNYCSWPYTTPIYDEKNNLISVFYASKKAHADTEYGVWLMKQLNCNTGVWSEPVMVAGEPDDRTKCYYGYATTILDDGTYIGICKDNMFTGNIWLCKSVNQGKTWTKEPLLINGSQIQGDCPCSIIKTHTGRYLFFVAINNYAVWTDDGFTTFQKTELGDLYILSYEAVLVQLYDNTICMIVKSNKEHSLLMQSVDNGESWINKGAIIGLDSFSTPTAILKLDYLDALLLFNISRRSYNGYLRYSVMYLTHEQLKNNQMQEEKVLFITKPQTTAETGYGGVCVDSKKNIWWFFYKNYSKEYTRIFYTKILYNNGLKI